MINALSQDLRYAARSIRRSPAYAAVVVGTIALAVGANTALFSIFNGLVLKTLPVREPERLVAITATNPRVTGTQMIYDATLQRLREAQRVFSAIALYSGGGALRVEVRGVEIDGGVEGFDAVYFDIVGARPALGRLLQPADGVGPNGAAVLVISDRLWTRLFARDPHAIGEQIRVNAVPLTVVGVTEPSFRGLQTDVGADLFMTMATLRPLAGDMTRPLRARNVIAQLGPGVTVDDARAAMQAQWPSLRDAEVPGLPAADQQAMKSQQVTVESIATGFSPLRQQYADPLAILVVLTGLLLAIGCANLSGLLLARAVAREQQVAVRMALGASRGRLVQQLLVETLLFAALGTTAAVPFAWWASGTLGRWLTNDSFLPPVVTMTPDMRVLAASALVAVVTGVLVGGLPAWHSTRTRAAIVVEGLRATAATPIAARLLIVAQIALSLVLLVSASLFARSMNRLRASEAQYQPSEIVWSRLWIKTAERRSTAAYPQTYWTDLAQQFTALPGVTSVAYATNFPVFFAATFGIERFAIADGSDRAAETPALFDAVSPGFFSTIGVPLLQGRDVAWTDTPQTTPVAVVTSVFAQKFFPASNALGRHIRVVSRTPQTYEIVGIVADAAFKSLGEPQQPAVFRAMPQESWTIPQPNVFVRVRGDAAPIVEAFRSLVPARTRHFVRNVYRLDEYVDQVLLRERLVMWLSSFFAGLAVLLSCVGLYGLLAYSVARRTREIGIRMALGASPSANMREVAREGLLLGVVGVAVGIPCALATGRLVRSMLYGLAPNDPATITASTAVFVLLAAVAGLIPAYRASAVDPMTALRHD